MLVMSIEDRKFALQLAAVATALAALPALIIAMIAPAGSSYLGHVYNTDDHMVYAAWMRQAMDGQLLFDNRFTTDAQPGLTIHLYFFVLGLFAKVLGIPLAANLGRLACTFLFVLLLHRLVSKLGWDRTATRLATAVPIIAGGIGFLVWQTFGQAFIGGGPELFLGKLPIDVWQPEVFVFPSMLTNGLFMVSLCLILTVFLAVLEARESKKAVLWGALAMLALMNIHSYDVLLVTFVLVGFLAATMVQKQMTGHWVLRAVLIGLGAIPAALWFVYVLRNDPVFQARAATETFSPNFRQVAFGLFLPMILGLTGLAMRKTDDVAERKRWSVGFGLSGFILLGLFLQASHHLKSEYFLDMPVWVVVFAAVVAVSALLSSKNPSENLFISWALVGTVAIYFPALFQRKLAMGLAIPWGVLAAMGVIAILARQDLNVRRLGTAFLLLILGATSLRWVNRELTLAKANVSNTTMHPVYLSGDMQRIFDYLNQQPGTKVLIAMPGIASGAIAEDTPAEPVLPDLNPLATGLTGVYTYAGHWSETPDYGRRRNDVTKLFIGNLSDQERSDLLKKTDAQYVLSPTPAFMKPLLEGQQIAFFDFSQLGEVVVDGEKFRLIKLNP